MEGGNRSVAGPPLIGCISIIITVRLPLPIWLRLLPFDWLRRHSNAIYKPPQGCFFFRSFFPPSATSVFFLVSLPGPNKHPCVCVCVCVSCPESAPTVCQHIEGWEQVEDLIETESERRCIYLTFEGERKSFSFTSKTGLSTKVAPQHLIRFSRKKETDWLFYFLR